MTKKELFLSLAAAVLAAIFLVPTLINTGYYYKIPYVNLILFIVLPILAVVSMSIANFIGKRILLIWQFAKFSLVGVLNTSIDFGILNFLISQTNFTEGGGIGLINVPSFSAAIINSYFWNRRWVFEDAKQGNFLTFAVITIIGLLINTSVLVVITTFIPPIFVSSPTLWANTAKVLATGISLVWNFAGYKIIVFRR